MEDEQVEQTQLTHRSIEGPSVLVPHHGVEEVLEHRRVEHGEDLGVLLGAPPLVPRPALLGFFGRAAAAAAAVGVGRMVARLQDGLMLLRNLASFFKQVIESKRFCMFWVLELRQIERFAIRTPSQIITLTGFETLPLLVVLLASAVASAAAAAATAAAAFAASSSSAPELWPDEPSKAAAIFSLASAAHLENKLSVRQADYSERQTGTHFATSHA